ncbi:suppressor of cytokine signaling [Ciona intestinalis]
MAEKNDKNKSDITKINASRHANDSDIASINVSNQTEDILKDSSKAFNIKVLLFCFKTDFSIKIINSFPSESPGTSSLQHDSSNPQEHVAHTVEQPSVSQATSSLQDMQINPQGGGVTSRKPTIEDISAPDFDIVGQLLQEKKYAEAYGVSRQKVKLDPVVIGFKDLVNHYRCCMLVGEAEEAIRTRNQLKSLLKDKFQTTPNEIKTFAGTIVGEGRDMEATLFSEIADDFMKPGSQHGRAPSLKPALQSIFAPDSEAVGQLLQEKKYGQAFGVSRKRIKLDPAVIESKVLVNHYRCCMLAEEEENMIQIRDQLKTLINEKYQTTPNEIQTFADTIRGEGRDMEAILFYQIAAQFYGNQTKVGLDGIRWCAWGIKDSIKPMLSRNKELKPIVRTQVIPLMRDIRELIRRSHDVNEEDRCMEEVLCLNRIEDAEYLVDNLDGRKESLEEAIAIMERVFKERAGKYEVYGTSLLSLGHTYGITFRPNDARQYFRKAIVAYRKVEDISDDKRAALIAHTEGKFQLYDPDRGVSRGAANCVRHPNIVTFIKLAMKHSRSGTFVYFIKTRNMGEPPVQIRLLTPISRFTCVKSLKYYVRFTIRDTVPYDSITNLPIPHDLKEYLLNSPYFDATEDLQCALLS